MTTSELVDRLYEYYDNYREGTPQLLFHICLDCKEAANKIIELQRFIDDMNGDHYVDYLEFYTNRCRKLEDKLEQIQNILNKE